MAAITTITPSFLAVPTASKQLPAARCPAAPIRASKGPDNAGVAAADGIKQERNNTRRDLMFAVATAAACAVARVAMADDQPKRGTSEAKKKYAPVCVTMPTARICHN